MQVEVEMAASTHCGPTDRLTTNLTERQDVEALKERQDVEALKEENRQLRELVIYLSKLVIRNATDRK